MNRGRIPAAACVACAACLGQLALAQPLAPVPPSANNNFGTNPLITTAQPGAFGAAAAQPAPVIANQPAVQPPPNAGVLGAPGATLAAPPPPGSDYYTPLPGDGAGAGAGTFPGGVNWHAQVAGSTGVTPRAGGGHLAGEDIGLGDGLSWLHGFVPLWQTPGLSLIFGEARAIKYNDNRDQFGFNGAVGWRRVNISAQRIIGAYGGFDYRDFGAPEFGQISGGFESLGMFWDFRGNAYVVVGEDSEFLGATAGNYVGTNLQVTGHFVNALSGFDVEAGRNFLTRSPNTDLRVFGGGYGFFNNNTEDVWGVRGRIEARFSHQVTANVSVQYDDVFDTTAFASLSILWGGVQRCNPCAVPNIVDRLSDPLYKNMHVVLLETQETDVARDSMGDAIEFLHVDSFTGTPNPDQTGAFETPFDTLAEAEANQAGVDIILLHGGSIFAVEDITLTEDGIRLLGDSDSVRHTVTTQFGVVQLPRANATVSKPEIIDTTALASVTVNAQNVEVSGLQITDPDDHGIRVIQTGANINRNMIMGADDDGGGTGDAIIFDFTGLAGMNGTGTITDNFAGNGMGSGIAIDAGGTGTFFGDISGNATNDNDEWGILVGGNVDGNVSGNTANGNSMEGIVVQGDLSGSLAENTANGNVFEGIQIDGQLGGNISGNTANDNGDEGIQVGSGVQGNIVANMTTQNGGTGIQIVGGVGGNVVGNMASDNTDLGIFLELVDNDDVVIRNNQLSGNNGGGDRELFVTYGGAASVRVQLDSNVSTNIVPLPAFNYEFDNTGGGTFNLFDFGNNVGTVEDNDGNINYVLGAP